MEQEDLNTLTNEQLRRKLIQYGFANVPVTDSTRNVLMKRLKGVIEGKKTDIRRETMHIPSQSSDKEAKRESKTSGNKTSNNRRATISAISADSTESSISQSKSNRRSGRVTPSGRITPSIIGIDNFVPISAPPNVTNILEISDEESVIPDRTKRSSRSPSLGKSQTVVTSYKTEVTKSVPIVESTEEENEESDNNDFHQETPGSSSLYPSLSINRPYISSIDNKTRTLRQSITNRTNYEPSSLGRFTYHESKNDYLPRPSYDSTLNRRHTMYTSNFEDKTIADDDLDVETPYLSEFTNRLAKLKPEILDQKIMRDIRKQHTVPNDSLWHSFSELVIAFGRKFGTILIGMIIFMIIVFIYVFFIMSN